MLYKAGAAHEMELELCPQDDGSHVTITLDKSKPLGLRIKEDVNGTTKFLTVAMCCGFVASLMQTVNAFI